MQARSKLGDGAFTRGALRPLWIVVAIGGLVIVVIVLAAIGAIMELRAHDIADAKRELTTLDLLLSEETERAMQSVDLILRNAREKIVSDGVQTTDDYARLESGRDTHDVLKSWIAGVPQVDAVTMIAADGKLINFSRYFPIPFVNVSDRDYYTALRNMDADILFLSEPVENRGTGTWTVYLARRVSGPSGAFIGLVLGGIDLAYFENLYKNLHIGPSGAVSLWRSDGTLLARYPTMRGVGNVFKIQSFSGILQSGTPSTYEVETAIDGPHRVVATMQAKQFPLVVNVTETFDEILQDWRRVATLIAVGAVLCVLATCFVVWLLARQFTTFEALALAVAERGQAVAAREEAEAQLRQAQKLESLGQLTGGIAHDFNNLLTAVLGNLELLRRHTRDGDARLNRWASNAIEAAKRGATLTQRLLAFSRRQPLDPQPSDIAQLLNAMSDLLARTLGENVEIETVIGAGLWHAFVDVNQLDSALLNIAINARDAMDGRGRLTIEASNSDLTAADAVGHPDLVAGQYILLALSDTGKGIAKELVEKVFEPFFTTKPIGKGTGLGLSQVYGFVKQTGGHIRIYSEVGQGTTVKIYLPRAGADTDAIQPRWAAGEEVAAPHVGIKILVVEDDADVRRYSVETLRDFGYVVVEAGEGTEALAVLKATSDITLLFTDVGLPGMNGRELADAALHLHPNLIVLFTTGYARNGIVHHGRLEPGVQLVTKPFTRAELSLKIRQALARAEAPAAE